MAKPQPWLNDRKLVWRCTNESCRRVHKAGTKACGACGGRVTDFGTARWTDPKKTKR